MPQVIDHPTREFEQVACLCGSARSHRTVAARNRDESDTSGVSFQVVQCDDCGVQFENPRPTPTHLKSYYPNEYYAYLNTEPKPIGAYKAFWERLGWWSKISLRRAFWNYPYAGSALRRWGLRLLFWPLWLRMALLGKDLKVIPFRGRGRLLEIGCGTGAGLDYQRLYGFTVGGVEMNPYAVEVAHSRYHLDVRLGTLEEVKFLDRAFDTIHMSHVFEHLLEPVTTLREMHRVLDDHGLIILKLPNIGSLSAKRFGPYWLGLDLPRHLYHFTPSTITRLLEQHGFAIQAIRQDVGAWGWWRESRRIQAQHAGQPLPREPWWRTSLDQVRERLACARAQGSNMVVYARKVS